MIEIRKNKTIHLVTENTSYLFSITDSGYPEHVYYGKRLKNPDICLSAIREKHLVAPVMSTIANREEKEVSLNDTLLEFSTENSRSGIHWIRNPQRNKEILFFFGASSGNRLCS